uniref:G-protein coupled receptors family 2 profile 2 domain-containing protein n=1 Tax=Anopheles culicifacies TaxID=139723 RepID=A0A182MK93_9DIPT
MIAHLPSERDHDHDFDFRRLMANAFAISMFSCAIPNFSAMDSSKRLCSEVMRVFTLTLILIHIAGGDSDILDSCPVSERIDLTEGVQDADGSILFAGNTYPAGNYTTSPENRRYSCVCSLRKCVYVCCFHIEQAKCEESSLTLNRTSSNRVSWVLEEIDLRASSEFWLIYATPPAWSYMPGYALQISGHEGELINVGMDGSFAYGTKVYASRTYCINPAEDSTPHVWIKETDEHFEVHRWHSLGMIISIPFLVATLIVYALIPDLRNIPGKSLMCYVFALTVSYLMLVLIKRSLFDSSPDWCTAVGYAYYFSLMSSFFWLNVMAFDIYWTFGGRRRTTTDQGKFLLYCCYGFGCPFVFLAIALVADHTELVYANLRPGFGDGQCLFKGEQLVSFLYLYAPLVLLVSANLFFFISTAVKINSIERTTAAALQGESGRHSKYTNERNRYGLYVRLFVVMGVTWTFEFITWLVNAEHWLVYVTDVCNCICGVFIFFLFVWKRKVWKLLQQRISGKEVRKHNQPLFSVSGTRTTSLAPSLSTENNVRKASENTINPSRKKAGVWRWKKSGRSAVTWTKANQKPARLTVA